jgi:hypothetical protein
MARHKTPQGEAADKLPKEFEEFMASVNVTLGDDDFIENLSRIGAQGRAIIRRVQTLVDHATDLKARWDRHEEKSGGFNIARKP